MTMQDAYTLEEGFTPPSPPPIAPYGFPPPPSPSPPRPRIPFAESLRLKTTHPTSVTLSTHFIWQVDDDNSVEYDAATGDVNDMGVEAPRTLISLAEYAVKSLPTDAWAKCTSALADAPLPCRTGDEADRCMDGAHRCNSVEDNMREPWLEIDLRDTAPGDGYYLHYLTIRLPSREEFAGLLFHSVYFDHGHGYEIALYDLHHNRLPGVACLSSFDQVVDEYTPGLRFVQHHCLPPTASTDEILAMQDVRYVRLKLIGTFRSIWISGISVTWRTLVELPPMPPPSPSKPPLPPLPHAPPDDPAIDASLFDCTYYANRAFDGDLVPASVVSEEPCGLSSERCCALMHEFASATHFTISSAGCCTLMGAATLPLPIPEIVTIYPTISTGVRTNFNSLIELAPDVEFPLVNAFG